jgi:hypothetical protein
MEVSDDRRTHGEQRSKLFGFYLTAKCHANRLEGTRPSVSVEYSRLATPQKRQSDETSCSWNRTSAETAELGFQYAHCNIMFLCAGLIVSGAEIPFGDHGTAGGGQEPSFALAAKLRHKPTPHGPKQRLPGPAYRPLMSAVF